MFDWRRPRNLGVTEGRLSPCRRTPNCVCSQADPADRVHYAEPIRFAGSFEKVKQIIQAMPGAILIQADGVYLYAEFRSRLLRFVDDVEVFHDEKAGLLHVRSASRLGRRDFDVNRKRVEALRRLIQAAG